jgi:hypothetical protein
MSVTSLKKSNEPERIAFAGGAVKAIRVHIVVDGIKPLLTHNPESMGTVKGPSKASRIPEPEDEAEAGVYRLPDGTCALKGEAFRLSLLGAAGAFKAKNRTTMKSILAHVTVVQELIPLTRRDGTPLSDYVIDKRRAIIQKSGIIRCRPRFDEWSCEVIFEYDPQLTDDPKLIATILHDAGNRMGVGDYRPQKNGPMGRYQVREYWVE